MKLVFFLLLGLSVLSCGGNVDNSEPPATLVEITKTAALRVLHEIEYSSNSSQYERIIPLELENDIVFTDSKGLVTVFNKTDFNIRWQKELNVNFSSAIGGNDNIYLLATRSGEVIALNPADGKILWRVKVSSEVLARPVVSDGTIIVKTVDGQLTALKAENGKEKWIYQREVPALSVRGNSTPLLMQDKIITGLDNGKLAVINLDSGQLFWEKTITIPHGRSEIDRLVDIDADLLVSGSIVYIGGFQGKITALDLQSGDFLWTKKMSVTKNMTLEDNKLYITDDKSIVWALDAATGASIWKQDVFSFRKLTSPVVMGDYLLLGDFQGYLHVIAKADGHQVTRLQVDEAGVDADPIVIKDKIYVQTRNSVIYVIDLKKLKL